MNFSMEKEMLAATEKDELLQTVESVRNIPEFENLDSDDYFRIIAIPKEMIIDDLNELSHEEKLQRAIDVGLLAQVDGKSWSYTKNRPIVFCKLAGETIPFYRSSKGTGGKNAGKWYPMFGFGRGNWMIKGDEKNCNEGYNMPAIRKIQSILDSTFDWGVGLDSNREKVPFSRDNLENLLPDTELNSFNNR